MSIIVEDLQRACIKYPLNHKGPFKLHPVVHNRIINAIKANTLATGMDFDRTMVNTDEINRIFPSIQSDKSRVIDPMAALGIIGVPIGIFTGNKPSYIDFLCAKGYRERLERLCKISAMETFRIYAQNSTWLEAYDKFGQIRDGVSEEYAKPYLFPKDHISAIEDSFKTPIQSAIGPDFMHTQKPLLIRPSARNEIYHTYTPIFERRNDTQLSWVAVPGEVRENIILAAAKIMPHDIYASYRFEPGGQFSIDINQRSAAKDNGTKHFRKELGISTLMYFGDSVYRKGDHTGNDLPVINDENALIFAVNPDQTEIPSHERIIKAGPGPDATRAWLTWLLANFVSIRFATKDVSEREKISIVKAITDNGVEKDFMDIYRSITGK
jgi:hypothetical protein